MIGSATEKEGREIQCARRLSELNAFFSAIQPDNSIFLLDEFLDHLDKKPICFAGFIDALLDTDLWKGLYFESNPYPKLCHDLSLCIDKLNSSFECEPPYHSRKHFVDVCIGISTLLSQNIDSDEPQQLSPWTISKEDSWLLLYAAIGHDYMHRGRINAVDYENELISLNGLHLFLDKYSNFSSEYKQTLMNKLHQLILPTCFDFTHLLYEKINKGLGDQLDYLAVLLTEADILASTLPNRGKLLSKRLSLEWEDQNKELSNYVASKEGYENFLQKVQFLSDQSKKLNVIHFKNNLI
jgi:hypothetical protein